MLMEISTPESIQEAWTLRFEEMGEAGLQDRRGRRRKDQTPGTGMRALST